MAVRGLTRGEALELRALGDRPDADRAGEVYLIAAGTGVSQDEAAAWWDASDGMDVQLVVEAVARLSRLAGKDGKDPKP